ncbi:peptidoglycan-binding domain-containing protein [Falsiroseomonas oryzae]|uniref:peptidoglycan-binding domain-containing protein n=1 Tax=Falsiroseomonas oryzae TaxID=2766473 RepID=UPI0022EA17B4|nr:peptidoglycan-binding domain-containing protein [Roseomonas sp. MO-31]
MTRRLLHALPLLLALAAPAQAADAEGRFALKGGGATSCANFVEARRMGAGDLRLFEGFVDGYVTAANLLTPDTFDLVPWQTTALLLEMLGAYCQRTPQAQFAAAVTRLVSALSAERLRSSSNLVGARSASGVVPLYAEVLRRVQDALRARNYTVPEANGAWDEYTRLALERFQRENNLPVNGLPDQRTLFALLQRVN